MHTDTIFLPSLYGPKSVYNLTRKSFLFICLKISRILHKLHFTTVNSFISCNIQVDKAKENNENSF